MVAGPLVLARQPVDDAAGDPGLQRLADQDVVNPQATVALVGTMGNSKRSECCQGVGADGRFGYLYLPTVGAVCVGGLHKEQRPCELKRTRLFDCVENLVELHWSDA